MEMETMKNIATNLEAQNSLLKLENTIAGERLKALYESVRNVISQSRGEDVITDEYQQLVHLMS
jgi:hypothetical protein